MPHPPSQTVARTARPVVRKPTATHAHSKKTVQQKLGTYVKLLQHMGPRHGTRLFFQLFSNRIDDLHVPAVRYPISLRKGTSDTLAFDQVFLYGEYAVEFGEDPRVVIDGGANIGMFSVFMKNRFPAAKIICIEPDKENFQQLRKNLEWYDDIHFENCGLWHKECKLRVWDKYELGKWAMVVEETEVNADVSALSINALMDKYGLSHIDVLKLDIEASEKELFSQNFYPWLSRTKMIIIELHDSMKEGCARQFFETVNSVFPHYQLSIKGENVILVNTSFCHEDAKTQRNTKRTFEIVEWS
jgi:FkbM family methyltransferase